MSQELNYSDADLELFVAETANQDKDAVALALADYHVGDIRPE